MAKVKELQLCPSCHNELAEIKQSHCPICKYPLTVEANPIFDGPAYIDMQLHEQYEAAKASKREGSEQEKEVTRIEALHQRWFRECKDEDRIASIRDSLGYIENIMTSNASVDCMRTMTTLGKRIGELAQSIERYASLGGRFYGNRLSDPATSYINPEDIEET